MSRTDLKIAIAEIDDAACEILKCYEQLPASAKASALKLGQTLSGLRQKMLKEQAAQESK